MGGQCTSLVRNLRKRAAIELANGQPGPACAQLTSMVMHDEDPKRRRTAEMMRMGVLAEGKDPNIVGPLVLGVVNPYGACGSRRSKRARSSIGQSVARSAKPTSPPPQSMAP